MIILNRVNTQSQIVQIGLQAANITEVTPKDENRTCWVKYWNGSEIRSMVVENNLDEIQHKVSIAKGIK